MPYQLRPQSLPPTPSVTPSNGSKNEPLKPRSLPPARWTAKVSLPSIQGCYVTKFAQHKALKSIARGTLTFDGRVVVRPVVVGMRTRSQVRQPAATYQQLSKGEQTVFANRPDLYHKSPDFGELQYTPRNSKRRFGMLMVLEVLIRGTSTRIEVGELASMAHTRQSRPDSGLGSQEKVLVDQSSLDSGRERDAYPQ